MTKLSASTCPRYTRRMQYYICRYISREKNVIPRLAAAKNPLPGFSMYLRSGDQAGKLQRADHLAGISSRLKNVVGVNAVRLYQT